MPIAALIMRTNAESALYPLIVWNGVHTDITERKRAEEALRLSENKFSAAIHATPDALLISRLDDGVIGEANDRFESLFGYTRDEAIGKSTFDLELYGNLEDRQRVVAQLRKEGFLREFNVNIRKKSGDIRQAISPEN